MLHICLCKLCHAQAKRAELKEIDEKLEGIAVVEQWQKLQDLFSKVLPWEQVSWLIAIATQPDNGNFAAFSSNNSCLLRLKAVTGVPAYLVQQSMDESSNGHCTSTSCLL